jgi:hypothetical protein
LPNNIEFRAQNEYVWNVKTKPVPAATLIPEWWKEMTPYINGEKNFALKPVPNVTVKRCFPMLDGITAGYIMPLWSDVDINSDEHGTPIPTWLVKENVFGEWPPQQVGDIALPEGYSRRVFKLNHGWNIKTPKGWSTLFIHPLGYPDLPFHTIGGLVDTDMLDTSINVPFVIKSGWKGVIEKGTPMFQMIPIKREEWKASYVTEAPGKHNFNIEALRTKLVSSYGRHMRDVKRYN